MSQIVVYGSPISGYVYYGPFATFEEADEWQKVNMTKIGSRWILQLIAPDQIDNPESNAFCVRND